MKAVVTGITGFGGLHLAEHLLSAGDKVLGFNTSGRWSAFASETLRTHVALAAWDLDNAGDLESARARIAEFAPDMVYHLAALAVPDDCGRPLPNERALAINVAGTARVAAMTLSLARPPRLVFTSTSQVYGPLDGPDVRLDENAPLSPRNGYAHSKVAAEQLLERAVREQGLDVVVLRPFQQSGPWQGGRLMLPSWARQFAQPTADPIEVFNLTTSIDLADVRDVVRAYRLVALHGGTGEVFNVGSGVARQTGEVFDLLRRLADPSGQRRVVETRPGTRYDPIADIDRLTARTGWRPEIPLETLVADTLADWRKREVC